MDSVRFLLSSLLDLLVPRHHDDVRLAHITVKEFTALAKPTTLPDGVLYLFSYSLPEVAGAIRSLKYRNGEHAARLFVEALEATLLGIHEDSTLAGDRVLIIPMPLSRKRLYSRGFNQVTRVLKLLPEATKGAFELREDLLERVRDTRPQARLSGAERRENMRDAFRAKDAVNGKRIVLVDDVTTTGATLAHAKRALRDAGARDVVCVALAH